jgi:hypothetical protein
LSLSREDTLSLKVIGIMAYSESTLFTKFTGICLAGLEVAGTCIFIPTSNKILYIAVFCFSFKKWKQNNLPLNISLKCFHTPFALHLKKQIE